MKQKAALLAAALSKPSPTPVGPPRKAKGPDPKGSFPLSRDQCAYYQEKGHWENECPSALRRKPKPQAH